MGELKNTFSWSFSAAADFDTCRRRRYWSKYGMWGGWNKNAPAETRKAYQLNKMDNCWSLTGQAVEQTVMRMLRQVQAGEPVSDEAAFETVARPFLRQKWIESKHREWERDPKNKCCLREHYYGTMENEKEAAERMSRRIKTCIGHFSGKVLPRLQTAARENELPVKTADRPGDPEHIFWNGIKMYVIPDYAYRLGDSFHIHDWKAGKVKESHREQLGLYALWAREKFQAKPEETFLYVEYLLEGQVAPFQMNPSDYTALEMRIESSVAEMTEYLIDFDRKKNEPLPKEEWETASSIQICRACNFFELCRSEIEEQGEVSGAV